VIAHYRSLSQRLMFSVTVFTVLLGNVFQQRTFLCSQASSHRTPTSSSDSSRLCRNLSLGLILRPIVSQPVRLGIKHPCGAYDQIVISQTVAGFLIWGALSDKRTGLSCPAPGPHQRSHFLVSVLWDS
jgi:hypothetical protein